MDYTKIDTSFVWEKSAQDRDVRRITELDDLQLALVGGGIGDPVAA